MGKQELDGVREVLETALDTLSEDVSSAESFSPIRDQLSSFEGRAQQTPVIIIMVGGPTSRLDQSRFGSAVAEAPPVTLSSSVSAHNERKVSHPGLERFTIETDSRPIAPKACFMEPGRPCVNSGACEMRGF
jgi:hypothetical protein